MSDTPTWSTRYHAAMLGADLTYAAFVDGTIAAADLIREIAQSAADLAALVTDDAAAEVAA